MICTFWFVLGLLAGGSIGAAFMAVIQINRPDYRERRSDHRVRSDW